MLPAKLRRRLPEIVLPVLIGIAATGLVSLGLDRSAFLNELETKATLELTNRFPPTKPSPILAVIAVDEASALRQGLANPTDRLDRRVYGRLIENLAGAGASVVLSDIIFASESPVDPELAASLKRATGQGRMRVVLTAKGEALVENPAEPDGFEYAFLASPALEEIGGGVFVGQAVNFAQDGVTLGGIAQRRDTETRQNYWHTALLAAWGHLRLDPKEAQLEKGRLTLGPWDTQLGGSSDFRLLWTENKIDFPIIPLAEAQDDLKAGRTDRYRDKVLILADLRGQDESGVRGQGVVAGSVIVANLINTLLLPTSERMRWPTTEQEFGWVALGAVMAALAARRGGPLGALGAPGLVLLWGIGFPMVVAGIHRFVLSAVWAGLAVGLAAGLCYATAAWFARPTDGRIEGEVTEATVLFSDLTNSTGIVQELGAQGYQRIYGDWLMECESIAARHGGLLERTTGDGFLIVFPHRRGSAAAACLVAVREMAALAGAKATFGFESGPVSGGYVREAGHRVWSSSGTTVNLSKRLQSLAGELGETCVLGPAAARMLSETTPLTRLGLHSLKGIEAPTDCYALPSLEE